MMPYPFVAAPVRDLAYWFAVCGCQLTTNVHLPILDGLMSRSKHANKEIEGALKYAESQGWSIKQGGSHAWGKIYCPFNDHDCRCGEFCISSVWSTPKNPANHAAQISRVVDNCARQREKREAEKRTSPVEP